jgi:hypothetical protein
MTTVVVVVVVVVAAAATMTTISGVSRIFGPKSEEVRGG